MHASPMGRTHNVDMAWTFERFKEKQVKLRYCRSNEQAADIFTKHFILEDKWVEVCHLIGHVCSKRFFVKAGTKPKFIDTPQAKAKAKAEGMKFAYTPSWIPPRSSNPK